MDGDSGQNCPGNLSFLLCKVGLPAVRFQLSSCPPHLINDTANTISKDIYGDFPSGLVAETPSSQCRGARVHSLVRELDLTCCN